MYPKLEADGESNSDGHVLARDAGHVPKAFDAEKAVHERFFQKGARI
jgi:hypothetical protein